MDSSGIAGDPGGGERLPAVEQAGLAAQGMEQQVQDVEHREQHQDDSGAPKVFLEEKLLGRGEVERTSGEEQVPVPCKEADKVDQHGSSLEIEKGTSPKGVDEDLEAAVVSGKDQIEETDAAGLKRKREDEEQSTTPAIADARETESNKHEEAAVQDPDPKKPTRYKKRKIAMFVSYSGYGYQGMQRNKGCKTIEGDLEQALFNAGAIAESTFGDPRKIDWARAARTDKGVSAAGQVVSGRFFVDPPGFVDRVNSHLPKQIRVLGFTRVTGTFSAKNLCDRRRYEYVLPVFAFDPASHRVESEANPAAAPGDEAAGGDEEENPAWAKSAAPVCTCKSSDLETGFEFGDEQRARLTKILQNYVGTHYFHNFTCRIKPEDPSTQRYMVSFEASDVFTIQGCKFVRCTVVGQSFMLHQIRKMIGLAVAVMRGDAPESIFESAFRRDTKVGVPMAPELGLFLDECLYSAYNQRFAGSHEEVSLKAFGREIGEFKADVIYPHIATTEASEGVFARWLHGLTKKRYPDLAGQDSATA